MKQYFPEEVQPSSEHTRQALEVNPTGHIPESSQKDQRIRTTDPT